MLAPRDTAQKFIDSCFRMYIFMLNHVAVIWYVRYRVYHIILTCLLQMAKAASSEKKLHFVENFGLSGAAAIISKTAAAPIERVKLLVQNQDEMLKSGRLETPYKGVVDCTMRTYRAEGFMSFWRGE